MTAANTACTAATPEKLVSAYDRVAAIWHRILSRMGYVGAYGDLIAFARKVLPKGPDTLKILDAGAGTAGFSLAFLDTYRRRAQFDLLDVSPAMLEQAKENLAQKGHASTTIQSDLCDLSVADGPYDVVLCAHLIEHSDNALDCLAALRRVLKPGGVLLLVVSKPHWCTWLVRLRWGHRAYQVAEMVENLRHTGFEHIAPFTFAGGPPRRMSAGYVAINPND